MRTSKEERADLRARCRAGVIAITTDAALVAALLDDVEELEATADLAARRWAIAASEASGLRSELARMTSERDEARAERDARVELTADSAEFLAVLVREYMDRLAPESSRCPLEKTLRAHAGKVAR